MTRRTHTMPTMRRTVALTAALIGLGACELDTTNPNAATETNVGAQRTLVRGFAFATTPIPRSVAISVTSTF